MAEAPEQDRGIEVWRWKINCYEETDYESGGVGRYDAVGVIIRGTVAAERFGVEAWTAAYVHLKGEHLLRHTMLREIKEELGPRD